MKTHSIVAYGPGGQRIELRLTKQELKEWIAEAVTNGVRASQKIEGEPLGEYPSIKKLAEEVPDSLLTTT